MTKRNFNILKLETWSNFVEKSLNLIFISIRYREWIVVFESQRIITVDSPMNLMVGFSSKDNILRISINSWGHIFVLRGIRFFDKVVLVKKLIHVLKIRRKLFNRLDHLRVFNRKPWVDMVEERLVECVWIVVLVVEKRKYRIGLLSRKKVDWVIQSRVHVRKWSFFALPTHPLKSFKVKERAMQYFRSKVVKVKVFVESDGEM